MPFTWPLATPWFPAGSATQATMDAYLAEALNELYGFLLPTLGFVADSGSTSITPSAANTTTSLSVTFNKTFASAPRVFCQFATGISGTATCFVWPSSTTTTGYTLNINRSTTTATTVLWFAANT